MTMSFGPSNVDQITHDLQEWIDEFNFTRPGEEGSLGHDVAMAVVEGIIQRSHDQRRGADVDWPENAPDYAAWKAKRYKLSAQEPNIRTGQMLSQSSLYGQTTIEPELVTMRYGIGAVPTRTSTGAELPRHTRGKHAGEQIDDLTDIEKAYFAHTGQGPNGVKRPFYELDEVISADVQRVIAENLERHIADQNRRYGRGF
jgi:hypothetical protein